jgi:uncharacterized protein YjbI with pentapeptide repeats
MSIDTKTALGARAPFSADSDPITGAQPEPLDVARARDLLSDDPEGPSTPASQENNSGTSISLLELAETLDLHKAWVESGGENGQRADLSGVNLSNADLTGVNLQGAVLRRANLSGADLSMANLRGANLMQADLCNANLLGTELRGADLMGAVLYGAEGLWVGRLGGANLFDALLPESIAAVDSAKAIAQATKVARFFYFLMLGICAACCVLIAFTSDIRLIVDGAAIPIGRFGKVLPLSGFYLGAPLLLFFLYLRFHFLLLSLWGNMAALPAVFPDGQTLERDGAWYLMGLARWHFRWTREARSAFSMLELVLAATLAYWIVPATLFFFWLRYLVRQDFRGTLLHALLLTLSVAAATCIPTIVSRVLRPGELQKHKAKNIFRMVLLGTRAAMVAGVLLLVVSFGISRGLPSDRDAEPQRSAADIRRWAAQGLQSVGYRPYAELTEATLSRPPAHDNWTEEGLAEVQGAHLNQMNLRFARAYRVFLVNAKLWRANLEGAYLSEADMRGANLREAVLRSANLDRALASHTILVSGDAARANFTATDLRFTDFSYGNLQDATLTNAKLSNASFYAANMRNTQMLRVDLSRSDLRDTKLDQSLLSFANLEQTDLSSARMTGAILTGAQMKGTILLDAKLAGADLRSASLSGAVLREADLTGANLAGADLRGALGLTAQQLCSAHWRGALLDPDVSAAVQTQCGSNP